MYKNNISINEVLNITNEYYISYYCKDNICILSDYNYSNDYIYFPEKDGNMKEYIVDICTKETLGNCITKCTKDIECFSNKCYKNYCIFNNETKLHTTSIVHCDDIYITPNLFRSRSSYMYCGKAYLDTCVNNDECSSKQCKNNYCLMQTNGPNESEGMIIIIYLIILIFILMIFLFIYIIIYILHHNKQT